MKTKNTSTCTSISNKILLVLSAPSIEDSYYKDVFKNIVEFQIYFITQINDSNDIAILLVDKKTIQYYETKLPSNTLIVSEIYDIWMRDFCTVNPYTPIQFVYSWASMSKRESQMVQKSFTTFADKFEIKRKKTKLILDGGNIVDNYFGRVITTTRFMKDNNLTYFEAKETLMKTLNAIEVAIIEPDEEKLAHSDGMVCWIEENKLLLNDYSEDPTFRNLIFEELVNSFRGIQIIEIPIGKFSNSTNNDEIKEWKGFESSFGIYLNAIVTNHNIYLPTFGIKSDETVIEIIKKNTSKNIIPINVKKVCFLGGSLRCMTWEVYDENATKLINEGIRNKNYLNYDRKVEQQ